MPAKKAPKKVLPRPVRPAVAPNPAQAATRVTLRLYRRIAIGFVIVVGIILAAVLYVATVRATIRLVPVEETVQSEFILDLAQTPSRPDEIRGRLVSGTIGRSQTFTPSGEGKKEVVGTARGTVTIFNKTNKNQPLVKTTRLLTPEGVLFRIDADVEVPAGGQVNVAAHADQPGQTGDIGPSRFTIPGLSASLQSVIYATSDTPMHGGLAFIAAISDQDLYDAQAQLQSALEEDAKTMLRQEVGNIFDGETFLTAVVASESDQVIGAQADQFSLSLTIKVIGVFFDRQAVEEIAARQLYDQLTRGREFSRVNLSNLQTVIEKTDLENQRANLRVRLDGVTIPYSTSSNLDPGRFVGMSGEQVRQTLLTDGIATAVQVDFFPFWIRRIPRLRDHIYLIIE